VQLFNPFLDQLELAEFVLELVLVLLSDLAGASFADAEGFSGLD